MRNSFIFSIIVTVFMVSGAVSAGDVPPRDGVLFYASFDNGLAADYSAGNPQPTLSANAELAEGKSGKGYVQNGVGSLRFACAKNILPDTGTVAFWVKPVNWDGTDSIFRHFFAVGGLGKGQRHMQLYRYYRSGLIWLVRNPAVKGNFSIGMSNEFRRWKKGEWHHLAITWDKNTKEVRLYCDGKFARGVYNADYFPAEAANLGGEFVLNTLVNAPNNDIESRTVIDDFYIFDRAVGERQIAELMNVGIKSSAPEFTLSVVGKAPKIDGRIAPGEYDEFFSTNTFVELGKAGFYPRECRAFVGYDAENLYVTMQSRTKGGDMNIEILAQRTKRDSDVWLDDAVELQIIPGNGELVQIVVNSIGTIYDIKSGKKDFDGNYEIANLIEGAWWVCEMKIPFRALGAAPPKIGDKWRMHIARDWKNPFVFASLSDCMDFSNAATTPIWTFGGHVGAELRLNLEYILQQRAALDYTLLNNTSQNIGATAEVYLTRRADNQAEVVASREINAAPGGKGKAVLSRDLTSVDYGKFQNLLGIRLVGDDGTVYQKSEYVLKVFPPMELFGALLLDRKEFLLKIDLAGLAQNLSDVKLACKILKAEKVIDSFVYEPIPARQIERFFKPVSWDEGSQYTLSVDVIERKNGKTVLSKSIGFGVPKKEAWNDFAGGTDHSVPPPWTPVKRTGNTVGVWNRDYRLGPLGLPAAIMENGKENLLASGAALNMIDRNGKKAEWVGKLTFGNDNADETTFNWSGRAGDFDAKLAGRIEFDGFTWYELSLTPRSENASLDALSLEFSIPESLADFTQINRFGSAYAELHKSSDVPPKMPWMRQILFGNDKRALAFYMETDKNFVPEHSPGAVEFIRKKNVYCFSMNFVEQKTRPGRELRFGFGFQAAPVKPLLKNWQNLLQNYTGEFRKEINLAHIWSWSRWYGFMRPINEKSFSKNLANLTRLYPGIKIQPYLCQYILSMLAPEYKLYSEEWAIWPKMELMEYGPNYPGKSIVACMGPDSYRSFWLYSFSRFIDDYPLVNGVYWDSIDPVACRNVYHGHGWTDSEGKNHPTNDILHYRDFYKRVYKMLKAKHPDAVITGHCSARRFLPTLAFCDVLYDGEQFVSNVSGNPNYCFTINEDYCRAFFGTQFGFPSMLLPAYYNNEKYVASVREPTESLWLFATLYNFLVHSHRLNNQVTDEVLAITRPFNLSEAEYIAPHDARREEIFKLTPATGDLRAAIYRKVNGKMLIAVGNFGAQKVTAELGFTGKAPDMLEEKRSGKKLEKNGNSFQIECKPYNFVLIEN